MAVVPVHVPVESANGRRLTAVANCTDVLVTAPAQGQVEGTTGVRPAVVSHKEPLEALQGLRQELGSSSPVDLLLADSTDVPIAALSHVFRTTGIPRRTSFHDDGAWLPASGGRGMTVTAVSREESLEALQGLRQELGGSGPVDLLFADSTDVPIAALSHVFRTTGIPRRTSFHDDGAWLPASGGRGMTATAVSREQKLEALQALRQKPCGPGPVNLLFAGPASADVLVAAPAHARRHSTAPLRRGTFHDTAIRCSEPLEAAT
ncbi:hypothetical protein UK23_12275 [Lentzea aerocolonigenes]|uniref:Uncharacterized protein n=1 Tax=Lentzea aerocolonigenes TaxID=68170 RepID=A0A0F0H561_LENAE|nr:hypothetical protein [Lentzea aerocolonigenes]KJK49991.1 hypothetical protein UK23_12275 [Lentzea aerocolonigenes]